MGSSPLTRGKLPGGARGGVLSGLIPAHAGKTRPSTSPRPRFRAHPRSRWENLRSAGAVVFRAGSSPLTRGKHCHPGRRQHNHGLIPAHAGKTSCRRMTWLASWAHPRSRGENVFLRSQEGNRRGSSPLTRGKRRLGDDEHTRERLIPAHAGKTQDSTTSLYSPRAHPRSRGENHLGCSSDQKIEGSSPLTRGKHQSRRERRRRMGLIPAHAGKTRRRPARTSGCRAHPRSRGENRGRGIEVKVAAGSSPLTRGKR